MSKPRKGVHAPNAHWTERDRSRWALGRFESVKLMEYHTAYDVQRLREDQGITHFLGRLPSSTVGKEHGGRWKGGDEWYAEIRRTIDELLPAGVTEFQLDT